MGPVRFERVIDETISDLAERIAVLGEKMLLANGARRDGDALMIPRQQVQTQALEYFAINDYGALWNPEWKLAGAGRGTTGATCLLGDVLVTYPRDTRPCLLERTVKLAAENPKAVLEVGSISGRPWRLQVMVDDDVATNKMSGVFGAITEGRPPGTSSETNPNPTWTSVIVDLSKYAGKEVVLRLYQWMPDSQIPGFGYWRKAVIE